MSVHSCPCAGRASQKDLIEVQIISERGKKINPSVFISILMISIRRVYSASHKRLIVIFFIIFSMIDTYRLKNTLAACRVKY